MYSNIATNAIITKKQDVLLTLRRDTNLWCLPGGMVEPFETVESSVLREIKEEILVDAKLINFIGMYSSPNLNIITPATRYIIVLVFHCSIFGVPEVSEEVSEVKYFNINNLPENLICTHKDRVLDFFYKELPVIK